MFIGIWMLSDRVDHCSLEESAHKHFSWELSKNAGGVVNVLFMNEAFMFSFRSGFTHM